MFFVFIFRIDLNVYCAYQMHKINMPARFHMSLNSRLSVTVALCTFILDISVCLLLEKAVLAGKIPIHTK